MIPRSSIAWTDFSGGDLNFVIGCTPASEGCTNCYARAIIQDRGKRDFSQVQLYRDKLDRLLAASFADKGVPFRRGPGSRPMAFVVDMGDLFHPDVPSAFIHNVFWHLSQRRDIDWQILTKRPPLMNEVLGSLNLTVLPHIWLGVTVENARHLDRISILRNVGTFGLRFVSFEPLLGEIPAADLRNALAPWRGFEASRSIDWVIVGGESGPHRRPFDPDWARTIRDICLELNIPFFYKQGSAFCPGQDDLLDGRTWKQFP